MFIAYYNQLLCCHLHVETVSIWKQELKVSLPVPCWHEHGPDGGRRSVSRADRFTRGKETR